MHCWCCKDSAVRYSRGSPAEPVQKRPGCWRDREIDAAAGWAWSYAATRRVPDRTTAVLELGAPRQGDCAVGLRFVEGVGGVAEECPAAASGDDAGRRRARR